MNSYGPSLAIHPPDKRQPGKRRSVLWYSLQTEAQEFIVLCNYLTRRAGEVMAKVPI